MRAYILPLALLASACATLAPGERASRLVIDQEGRTVTAGGQTWRAPDGVSFFERGGELHVYSLAADRAFDVAVPVGPDGRLVWPAALPFVPEAGVLRLSDAPDVPRSIAALVASEQLHPHDEHYHLTHRFQNADWQALYAARAETSDLPPLRRQVAALVLTTLLDRRIPGSGDLETAAVLRRLEDAASKARRALGTDLPGRLVLAMAEHDFEILEDGRALTIEGQAWRAGPGLKFTYCTSHFHVEAQDESWASPVRLEEQVEGTFTFPPSVFYLAHDGQVDARPLPTRWRTLMERGEIRYVPDHWHVTERYGNPRFARLVKAMDDTRLAESLRDRARGRVFEVMRLRLDVATEADFDGSLAAVDQAIERVVQDFEREAKGPRR